MPWPNTTAPGGGAWSARHGGFVYYHGQGEREVILVKPSASPRTTPWIVSSIALTGDLPAADTMVGAGAHCKRFLEHPQADGFVWLGQTSAPPQWFRV
jgi:hypothetical protein